MPLVWHQDKCRAECSWAFPWSLGMTQRAVITNDISDGATNTTNLLLSCNNNTLRNRIKREGRWDGWAHWRSQPRGVQADDCKQTIWHFSHFCWVVDWAPSITFCATPRQRSWRATWTIQLGTYTASVTQWPVTIWTTFFFWHCSPTRSWWQVQEHEHYLSTQRWAKTCIRATRHTYSGYHCP
jgi:hypothetical protein